MDLDGEDEPEPVGTNLRLGAPNRARSSTPRRRGRWGGAETNDRPRTAGEHLDVKA